MAKLTPPFIFSNKTQMLEILEIIQNVEEATVIFVLNTVSEEYFVSKNTVLHL